MDGDSRDNLTVFVTQLAPVNAAISSSLHTVSCFNSVTLVLAITKQVLDSLQTVAEEGG